MPRSSRQKLKLLYLMRYLLDNTDPDHTASVKELIDYLAAQGISAERKSIYDDLEALRLFGLDIESTENGRNTGYYIASRDFELPELKLLVDSIQSSKFITHRKTAQLIRKIETLASVHEAQLLQRQVYVTGRVKTMNESIYYNVDKVHTSISQNRKIRFKYFEYTVTKEKRLRGIYTVSPYALTWDNENYYMVSYDDQAGIIKHFRVDKMGSITLIDEPRGGQDAYEKLDMAAYSRKVFGMFSGEEQPVQLRFSNHLAGAVLDRLGRDAILIPDGDEHFTVWANVVVSPQFFAWVCGFGDNVRVLAPADVVTQMKAHIESIAKLYS